VSRADAQASPYKSGFDGGPCTGRAHVRGRHARPGEDRPARWLHLLEVGVLAGAVGFLGACGSPGTSQASAALVRSCQGVAAVLSEGPAPAADPVGYAEAQIRPLTEVRTADRSLRQDIQRLDRAYREVFASNDSPASARAERIASVRLDAVCPKAAP
jgi:hypothetical protein